MSELKECPFCGQIAVGGPDDSYGKAIVGCHNCEIYFTEKTEDYNIAIESWNTRSAATSPWRPFAEAPTDGSYVLIAFGDRAGIRWYDVLFWSGDTGWCDTEGTPGSTKYAIKYAEIHPVKE